MNLSSQLMCFGLLTAAGNIFGQLMCFGLLAAAGNLFGGFLLTRLHDVERLRLKQLIALGAGFILAAVLLEVVPETSQQWGDEMPVAMGWMVAGYMLVQLMEHTIAPHFHFGEEIHHEEMKQRGAATAAVIALSIHAFFDGVAIAAGLLTNFQLGLVLFIAVLLHKIPEGVTAASIILSSGKPMRSAQWASATIAMATFAGVLSVTLASPVVKYALPLSAGVTLYIAASDLIPEVNHNGWRASVMVFIGVAMFYLTHLLLHAALG
ncbi:MAG TPA: ZIP family metal transporter [Blastocatellia bacterium]|nr:ZIP family metal transporter [Blastocatellia bacterium]